MFKLRNKIAEYQSFFYLVFIAAMVGLVSAGLNSGDKIYHIVFIIAALFLLIKLALTDFSLPEILVMAAIGILAVIPLFRSGEKTLLLTLMGIYGAKNVSVKSVFQCCLYTKIVCTVFTVFLAAAGVIENELHILPKGDVNVEIYSYGYYHPNMAFANIFLIVLFAILAYQDKLKWYVYAAFTVLLAGAYKVFICRTGLIVWGILLVMIFGFKAARKVRIEKVYFAIFPIIPILMAALTFLFPYLGGKNAELLQRLNAYFTGRISHILNFFENYGFTVFGHVPAEPFDSMYYTLLYNYGGIMFLTGILAYVTLMCYCIIKEKYYEVIALGVMAIYGFMELYPLSIAWNLPLIYLSFILFKGKKKESNDSLQQKV